MAQDSALSAAQSAAQVHTAEHAAPAVSMLDQIIDQTQAAKVDAAKPLMQKGVRALLREILQALRVTKSDTVLEIGAGSGWFAALLAARAEWVRTMEIEPELVKLASANLERNGVHNVVVVDGDGVQGWSGRAPYDVIVVSGGLPFVPQSLLEQLKVGGRLFAFVGEAPVMKARLITCEGEGRFRTEDVFETVVPMLKNAPQREAFSF